MNILVAGDFCPQNRVADLFNNKDYASVLSEVKEVVAKSDYSIVNFECPVVKGDAKPIVKCGPNLRCNSDGVEALKWAGFDCVTLANNHFYDYGEEGVEQTISCLDSNGIDHVGGGMNIEEASNVLYKKISGETLAIINCCEHEFSIATEESAGSNPLNPIRQYYAIKEARKNSNYVLVIVHGGHEHFQLPSLRMVETYRFFIDAGADAVVNHHQHCYSGYEIFKGKPIFYGLGNFCFDNLKSRNDKWNEGYAVKIDFSIDAISFTLNPYQQCSYNSDVHFLDYDAFSQKLSELNSVIADNKKLKETIEAYFFSKSNSYIKLFEPVKNRYYLYAKQKGWVPSLIKKRYLLAALNFVICESHREKLISALKSKF